MKLVFLLVYDAHRKIIFFMLENFNEFLYDLIDFNYKEKFSFTSAIYSTSKRKLYHHIFCINVNNIITSKTLRFFPYNDNRRESKHWVWGKNNGNGSWSFTWKLVSKNKDNLVIWWNRLKKAFLNNKRMWIEWSWVLIGNKLFSALGTTIHGLVHTRKLFSSMCSGRETIQSHPKQKTFLKIYFKSFPIGKWKNKKRYPPRKQKKFELDKKQNIHL